MKFKVRVAVIVINIVAMFCGLLIFSVSVQDRMKYATTLPLEKNKYKEVNELVNKYIDAKKNEDFKKLAECVNNIDDYDKEKIKAQNAISESISNVICYTIDGYYENTYVVFLYKEDKWKKIDVVVPSIDQLYVCEYNGKLCIYSGTVGDSKKTKKIKEYNNATIKNPNVKKILEDVNDKFNKIKDENAEFRELYYKVMGKEDPTATNTPEPSKIPEQKVTPVPSVSADPKNSIG